MFVSYTYSVEAVVILPLGSFVKMFNYVFNFLLYSRFMASNADETRIDDAEGIDLF